ncbi:MAG: hypothetical protein EXS64_13870 [Candidatus Latescibacteria bacterium]|nr:hypothetical protein [Candidatus Latescibacterota bacterium]
MIRLRTIVRLAGILVLAFSWADTEGAVGPVSVVNDQGALSQTPTAVHITRAVLDAAGGAMVGPRPLRLRSASLGSAFQTGLAMGRLRLRPGFVQQVRRAPAAVQPLVGDFTGDSAVDFDDFFLFAVAFGSRETRFDLSGDGRVDFDDFFLFAAQFGKKR